MSRTFRFFPHPLTAAAIGALLAASAPATSAQSSTRQGSDAAAYAAAMGCRPSRTLTISSQFSGLKK